MLIYDDYDDSYDLRWLQKLPIFTGLNEKEIRRIVSKIAAIERKQWEDEEKARQLQERANDNAYLEENIKDSVLPQGQVQIQQGITIHSNIVDDRGFIPTERLHSQKPVMKLFLDEKKKIYI